MWIQHIERPLEEEGNKITATPQTPFSRSISAVGIVEPSSETIFITTPLNRVVEKMAVKVGEEVKKGQILFELEHKDLLVQKEIQLLNYKNSLAKIIRLKALPQPEDLAVAESLLKNGQVEEEKAKNQYEMALELPDPRAISLEERNRRKYAFQQAQAHLSQLQAERDKIASGAWLPDLEIAVIEAEQAKANIDYIDAQIEQTIARAPFDATVLQIKVKEGELPNGAGNPAPILALGDINTLFMRVSINQFELPFFDTKSKAIAFLQGNPQHKFALEFVHEEPLLVAKQNLTNDILEKIDTRVLQVIYKINAPHANIYVGQQMDVFIAKAGKDER